MQFKITL